MLRFQIALAIVLVGCTAFLSCDRELGGLDMAEIVTEDMPAEDMPAEDMPAEDMPAEDMPTDTMMSMEYKSWDSVTLAAPVDSGKVHGAGARTVYFNEAGAMANRAGDMYPAGTMIVKELMDDANTFVQKIAKMTKTEDPMYADHGGWMYVKYARASETDEYAMVGGGSMEKSVGCDGCHSTAKNDYVFVSLAMKDDEMLEETMPEETMPEGNGDGNDAGNGAGNDHGAGNGNGNGAAQ